MNREPKKTGFSVLKKSVVAASVTAMLGAGVLGTGFVSPAMADALKKIPGFGVIYNGTSDQAVESARSQGILSDPKQSVTHNGITLKLATYLYDGTRLSFVLEREGVDLENMALPLILKDAPEAQLPKGYIEGADNLTLLADGQEIKYTSGGFGDVPYQQKTSFKGELTGGLSLPDQFELTIRAKVTQVSEPFEFKVPVQIDNKALVLKPNISKSDGLFSYTVQELYISPLTTRLVLDSKGAVPQTSEQTGEYSASRVYYEIVDDQGNELEQHTLGYFNSKPGTAYHLDELYAPFVGTPKSITIKPFTFTVKNNDWSVVGEKKDSKGNHLPGKDSLGTRTYLKDLEMTLPVNR
ncbi:DUF4179 domain-containing protein [Paenibacillus donghaensis]